MCFAGLIEMLLAKPFEQFSWPLEVDPIKIIQDYQDGRPMEEINPHPFTFTMLPVDLCQGQMY